VISLDCLRDGKYSHHIAKRSSRTKIEVIFAGLKDTGIACKMALHADIVSKVRLQLSRIHD
jgi:hypothetical protein